MWTFHSVRVCLVSAASSFQSWEQKTHPTLGGRLPVWTQILATNKKGGKNPKNKEKKQIIWVKILPGRHSNVNSRPNHFMQCKDGRC